MLVGIFRRGERHLENEPVDPDARSPESGIKYKDLEVMRQLLDHGANLDEPRHVVHFSIFSSQDGALEASRELSAYGWTSEPAMPLPAYPGQWSVKSERAGVVLALVFVRDSTAVLEAIAARHGGEYDGWEASV